jgi:glucokinase
LEFIAGDIGGTKTILALFSTGGSGSFKLRLESEFVSRNYSSFSDLLQEFTARASEENFHPEHAYIGVAGPVVDGRSQLTNLTWRVDEEELSSEFGLKRVYLMNDLVAIANYVPHLKPDETRTLNPGNPPLESDQGTIAVISPGTGLGEGFLTRDGGRWHAHASEGGHCDFAPLSKEEEGLREYLAKKFEHVSYEKICSGPGIYNISSYFHEVEGSKSCPAIAKLGEVSDPTPVLVAEAMREETRCQTCVKTLETFVSVYGTEAANLGLKVLARNGIFISGRLTLEILPFMLKGGFMESFLKKGRMSGLVSQMPLKVILTHRAPLLGAAHHGLDSISPSV